MSLCPQLTQQLPADASPTEEVKHVDSALEEILETEETKA
jgi:hypothetical protein